MTMADNDTEMEQAERELAEATAAAAALAEEESAQGSALTRMGSTADAEAIRASMQETRRRAERATRDVTRATERVKRELDRKMRQTKAELDRKLEAVQAALAPVEKRIELMREGIETIGLYLSAAEGIVQVCDGEPADELEPIVIRQMVLPMDEESGLFSDKGGINADKVDSFDAWLRKDWERVVGLLPETKCVVACVARFSEREHGDPWSKEPKDQVTHFLVRNGERVYRTTVNDFMAGHVLLPRADEFAKFFKPRFAKYSEEGVLLNPLRPGTEDYAEAMESADKRGRHFLRIGLILQGLVDNSDVFAPLHPAGINMLTDPSERSEKVRIVTDYEGGLESGDETFLEWQERVNAQLRPGMRVIGAFGGWDSPWHDANGNRRDSEERGHSRVHPTGWSAPTPPSGVPMLIEDRRSDGGLVCRFGYEVYDRYEFEKRAAKTRASVTLYPADSFILPFDLIDSSEQLAQFLRSRKNRRDYRESWGLIRSAMFAKAAEEAAEAPFRVMLAGVLARENGVSVEDAERDVDELVRWFKLKNRWQRSLTLETMRELTDEQAPKRGEVDAKRKADHEALAVRLIVAEHARRVQDRRRPINQAVVDRIRRRYEHGDLLAVVRPRKGGYMALVVADPEELAYVHEHEYSAKGELREEREWRLMGTDRPTRWTFAYLHEQLWKRWHLNATDRSYLTGPERAQLVSRLAFVTEAEHEKGHAVLAVTVREPSAQRMAQFVVWTMERDAEVPEDLLSGHRPREPKYTARVREWRREGSGVAAGRARTLKIHRPNSWYDDEHTWVLGRDAEDGPWTGQYAQEYAKRFVWGPLEGPMKRWRREVRRWREAEERRHEVAEVYGELKESIAAQWEAEREWELYEEFTAARAAEGDEEWEWSEWHEHRKDAESGGDGGGGPYRLSWGAYPNTDGHALSEVLALLVDRGVTVADLEGKTVGDALRLARDEYDLPKRFTPSYQSAREQPLVISDATSALVFGAEARPVPMPEGDVRLECVHCLKVKPASEFVDPEHCRACMEDDSDEEPNVALRLDDDTVVLGPEDEDPDEMDEFDALRDVLR